jgi:hypothetical protein
MAWHIGTCTFNTCMVNVPTNVLRLVLIMKYSISNAVDNMH